MTNSLEDSAPTPEHHGDVVGSFGLGGMDDKWGPQEIEANLGDQAVEDAVLHLLREDPLTHDLDLDVDVRDGHVYLQGQVASQEHVAHIEALARQASGVVDVVNQLTLSHF